MDQINVAGAKIYDVVLSVGYWSAAIVGGIAVINALAKKDPQSALKTALSYGVAFAALFILKWGLDLVRSVFS